MIIVIDGPSGAGKGTIAKYLSEKFGLRHLDSGLLFRTLAFDLLHKDIPLDRLDLIMEQAKKSIPIFMSEKPTDDSHLRNERVGDAASKVALFPPLRDYLSDWMRSFANEIIPPYQGNILDGRDLGTIFIPHADLKFFITASAEARMHRRVSQLEESGVPTTNVHQLHARDHRDQTRTSLSGLSASDAVTIDTTHMTLDDVKKVCEDHIHNYISQKTVHKASK